MDECVWSSQHPSSSRTALKTGRPAIVVQTSSMAALEGAECWISSKVPLPDSCHCVTCLAVPWKIPLTSTQCGRNKDSEKPLLRKRDRLRHGQAEQGGPPETAQSSPSSVSIHTRPPTLLPSGSLPAPCCQLRDRVSVLVFLPHTAPDTAPHPGYPSSLTSRAHALFGFLTPLSRHRWPSTYDGSTYDLSAFQWCKVIHVR
ncbi:uncharacterized protein LOC118607783 [Rousettus aegyptiacus]|uniref:uncharacterized protein LOC118607783 n=1 Tax=Rousettus aegyptiacus TaxID=9407 RepID=UPI00168D6231|nr:uncharacterized protein LOC118607783 [Rousettus aegyptiacus]